MADLGSAELALAELAVVLTLSGVEKRLGGRKVLDGLALVCPAGERALVLGANGSGKSTLLRAVAGIIELDAGEISIAGHSLRAAPNLAKAQLGYAPDGLEALPDLRAGEFLALVRALKGLPRQPTTPMELEWQRALGFDELSPRRLQALSFGQRKRVGLTVAVSGAPPLLLLDEPSNGLDPGGVRALVTLLEARSARGLSEVVATNDPELAARLGGSRHELIEGRLCPAPQPAPLD